MHSTEVIMSLLQSEPSFWECVQINALSYTTNASQRSEEEMKEKGMTAMSEGSSAELLSRAFRLVELANSLKEKYSLDTRTLNRYIDATTRSLLFN